MEADVVIVGGGPAGATAALNLAPFHRTLVIEGRALAVPRIGESLAPAARRLFADMGLWESFLAEEHAPCHGNRSVWGEARIAQNSTIRDPDGPGWRLDRARFESWLRAAARERGAGFLTPARLKDVREEGEGWIVSVESASGSLSIGCRFLIDATGRAASVARRLGVRRETQDRLACGWLYGADGASVLSETTFVEATGDGWWYTAPLPDRRRVLAFHTDADLPSSSMLRSSTALMKALGETGVLEDLLKHAGFVPETLHGVTSASGSRLLSCGGTGWLAVGDAATAFDPLSSQGLFNALYTGLAGAECAHRRLAGEVADTKDYRETIRRVWSAYVDHRSAWYGLERRWPDRPFWRRRLSEAAIPLR